AGSFVSVVVATDTDAILASETPISTALSAVDADVLRFNDHLTTLASPYMAGRVPGEPGMERAMQYCEFWFTEFGLEPAFEDEAGEPTFRQPFDLGGRMELVSSEASFKRGLRRVNLIEDEDYIATALGTSDSVTAPMIFVGYSVEDGPDGYTNFEGADVEGKIAVFFRFEPMDDGGNSAFQDGRGWTGRAGFRRKLNAVFDRGAAGAIIINPPGSSDPRAETLSPVGGGGGGTGPVLMLSQAGGEKLVERFDPEGRSLMELRRFADTEGGWFDMQGRGTIEARFERTPTVVENVAALLPGRGDLADEVIVIGAHLDHLGMGYFGSRSGPGELHAGADDNASGSAGVLLIAEKLKEAYDRLPDDADARTIKLVLFTAEESGLNGSRYMAQNPTRFAIEDHVLMINFDMIGRIENDRLSVSGMNTGVGLMEFCEPFFADSGLDCVVAERMSGASDHTSYYDQGVPVLFAIIADFHEDYHTPADVSEKINRVGATKTARLYTRIALAAAQRTERFEFTRQAPRQRAGGGGGAPGRMDIRVRFGVQPSYTEDLGVGINAVTDGGSAGVAGVEAGDVLVRWDGQKVENIEAWMGMLSQHDPGDVIKIGVLRDDVEVTLEVTLQGR
ncbi:MAG: M20/M25/M40 family metallo-hydrolase, partial [Planctomycetota bacterium]